MKTLFNLIFGIAGIASLLYGGWLSFWGIQSTQWPSVNGVVLSSGFTESSDDKGKTYAAKVRYEYFINSQRFTSDRIVFGNYSSSNRGHARYILSRYPVGKEVQIFYNPGKPEMSVLEQGVAGGAYLALGMGAAFLGFALFMSWAGKQSKQQVLSQESGPNNRPAVFQGNPAEAPIQAGRRREVSREGPRVTTNYTPHAVVMGLVFLLAGIALVSFEIGKPDGTVVILLGIIIASFGGILAWHAAKGLRLRNIRRENQGHSPWQFDYPWDRTGATDHAFNRAFRALYAIAMISLFLIPLQILLMKHAKIAGPGLFVYFVLGVFDLVMIAGFAKSAFLFIRAKKFGKNRILFHSFPFAVGSDGTVTFSGSRHLCNQSMHAELQCIKEYHEWRGSGTDRSSRPVFELVFSQAYDFRTDGNGKAELTFHIPEQAISTDLTGSPPFYWELEVSAKMSGIDYQGIFLMPVYKTA